MTRISVKRDNIAWAIQQSSTQCAIAQALVESDDDIIYPHVDQNEIRFTSRRTGERYVYTTPPKAAKWIDDFDTKPNSVKPMNFELDLTHPIRTKAIRKAPVATRIQAAQKRGAVIRRSSPTYRPLREQYT